MIVLPVCHHCNLEEGEAMCTTEPITASMFQIEEKWSEEDRIKRRGSARDSSFPTGASGRRTEINISPIQVKNGVQQDWTVEKRGKCVG